MSGPLTLPELAGLSVDTLSGAGPKRVAGLKAMGIESILDLLFHYPRRYLDRTRQARIVDLQPGDEAMVIATVRRADARRTRNGKVMVTISASDGSGTVKVTFFNQAWRQKQLSPGTDAVFFGKLEDFRGTRQMTNPVVDLIGDRTGRIVPVYPQSEKAGLTSWELGELVGRALQKCQPRGLADPLDRDVVERLGLIDRGAAFGLIHRPEAMSDVTRARDRLVLDELLRIQVTLVQRKRVLEREAAGIRHVVGDDEGRVPGLVRAFLARQPHELTGAQARVIDEIRADLAAVHPMHRLLQGDVGAGKTLVAVTALLVAVQGGHQGAFMAPTEVLATQHAAGIGALLDGFEIDDAANLFGRRSLSVELLTNRTTASERRRILAGLEDGTVDILIGTHALIQEGVRFASLGLAVIDEQHRFGVEQRAALRASNPDGTVPDVLVMTATPIPRSAAMTVYGDLDVSIIDELPPGRTPVATHWARSEDDVAGVWRHVREEVAAGRQAYVVCPLVEESEKLEVASATETYERLAADELAGLRVGLLHGRMKGDEKEAVMGAFRHVELDVLVATTVIEVGVDVPNATVMVVLDADRFGIAQLHQLRGRVGRGRAASTCYLVAAEPSGDGEERIEAMVATNDGFALAEVDLELRGEGTIMGERQKGRNDLRLASLRRDRAWVERAREVAFELVDGPGGLAAHPVLADEVTHLLGEDDADFLLKG
jgi:ATP-dependent DNA helicase RecG